MHIKRAEKGRQQHPQPPPFSWILIKCEYANTELNPIPSQKFKKVVPLISMETQPGCHRAEGSTSQCGQPSLMEKQLVLCKAAPTQLGTHPSLDMLF